MYGTIDNRYEVSFWVVVFSLRHSLSRGPSARAVCVTLRCLWRYPSLPHVRGCCMKNCHYLEFRAGFPVASVGIEFQRICPNISARKWWRLVRRTSHVSVARGRLFFCLRLSVPNAINQHPSSELGGIKAGAGKTNCATVSVHRRNDFKLHHYATIISVIGWLWRNSLFFKRAPNGL